MGFYVRNNTPNTIWLSIGYYDPDCSPVTYVKEGWYQLTPGRRSLIVTGSAANQNFYFYAHDNFNNTWSGDYYTQIPSTAYSMCWIENCETCTEVGFRRIVVGNTQNYTLTLTSAASGLTKFRNSIMSRKGSAKFKLNKASLRRKIGKVEKLGRVVKPLRGKIK